MKKLKPLKEFNQEMDNLHLQDQEYPRKNGIECPKCGEELYDKDSKILLSNPPQKFVICMNCNYYGYRYC